MSLVTQPSISTPTTTLEWATFYAGLGWSIVPVRPAEKLPAVAWTRFQREPATEAQLHDWFAVGGYGIGIITGAVSGMFVLDFDGEAGQELFNELERQHGTLPTTPNALTPGGGIHVIFQHPGRHVPTRKNVLPGLDIRGDGGFIVAHPSMHRLGRRYEWDADAHPEDITVAAAPTWVLDLVCADAPPNASHPTTVVHTLAPGPLGLPQDVVADGRETYMRDTILAVLRALRDRLSRSPTADELFAEVWPQYSRKVDLTRAGRGADEVMAKIRYTLRRVQAGAVTGMPQMPLAPPPEQPQPGDSWSPVPAPSANVFPTLDIAALSNMPPVEWLIQDIITADGFGITYGPPASLKSFLLIAWSLHIASGTPWLGRPVKQGGVLYVAGEGVRGMGRRVRAWLRHHGMEGVDLPFRLLPASVNLTDPEQLAKLVRTAVAAAEAEGTTIAMVVIDTVARAIPGADENSAQDMGRLVAAVEHIKAAVTCHVHGVHHSGKDPDRGARGSSALLGAVDTMVKITREGECITVSVEKQKDDEEAEPLTLHVEKVDLSHGLTLEQSLVLVGDAQPKAASEKKAEPAPATDNDQLLQDIIGIVGPGGRMVAHQLTKALGWSAGRSYERLNNAIPVAPNGVDVTWQGTPVRLWRARSGTGSKSPVEVVCEEI